MFTVLKYLQEDLNVERDIKEVKAGSLELTITILYEELASVQHILEGTASCAMLHIQDTHTWDWESMTNTYKHFNLLRRPLIVLIKSSPFDEECKGSDLYVPWTNTILKLSDIVLRI